MSPARALSARATRTLKARSKYGAQRTIVDGIAFHSAAESRRYAALKLLEQAGAIRALALQPRFDLYAYRSSIGGGGATHVGVYVGDFQYEELRDGRWQRVVEDVKGMITAVYRLKKKLAEACHGITIREIR